MSPAKCSVEGVSSSVLICGRCLCPYRSMRPLRCSIRIRHPRDVVVDQVVALGVQVHALGRHVAGDQDSDRRRLELERFDDRGVLGIAKAAVQDGHLPQVVALRAAHLQVVGKSLRERGQGRDALGEDDDARLAVLADPDLGQLLPQGQILRRCGDRDRVGQLAQSREGRPFCRLGRYRRVQTTDAFSDGLRQGRGRREVRLGEDPREQRRVLPRVRRGALWPQPEVLELSGDRVLRRGRRDGDIAGWLPLRPLVADLTRDVRVMAVPPDDELGDLGEVELTGRGDRARIQHPDQLGERLGLAVVRCGRGEDEGVRIGGQQCGEPVVLRGAVRDVVRFVDHDRVPALFAKVRHVPIAFQRVDRDDDALVVGERVPAGREHLSNPLNAGRIQADEGEREPRPQLHLHLLEHVLRRHDEDAVASAPSDQFREDHADLDGLAQTHRVREQDARPQFVRVEGLRDRLELVVKGAGETAPCCLEARVRHRDRRLAQHRFEPQSASPESIRRIGDHSDRSRIDLVDAVESCREDGGGLADQLGQARDVDERAVRPWLDRRNEPLLVPDDYDRSGRAPERTHEQRTPPRSTTG